MKFDNHYVCIYDKESDPKWFVYPTHLDLGFSGNEFEGHIIVEAIDESDALQKAQEIYKSVW